MVLEASCSLCTNQMCRWQRRFQNQCDLGGQRSRSHLVILCNTIRNLNSSFIFITKRDHIILQHKFLNTTMPLESNDKIKLIYSQLMAGYANSFIFHTEHKCCLWCVDYKERYRLSLCPQSQSLIRICLTVVCL